jgi:hypothetical protein
LRLYMGNRPWRVVADAYFSKASFLNPLLAAGITVISRLRRDAVSWDNPAPVVGKRSRGRTRKKSQAWKLATLLGVEAVTALVVTIYGKEERLRVIWRDMWLREVTCQVRVVVSATEHAPILLVSTDLTLLPAVIIQLYGRARSDGTGPEGSEAVLWAGGLLVLYAVGHPSGCPSRRNGLLSVAADAAPGSAGSLARGECMNSTRPLTPLSIQRLPRAL